MTTPTDEIAAQRAEIAAVLCNVYPIDPEYYTDAKIEAMHAAIRAAAEKGEYDDHIEAGRQWGE